MHGSTAKMVEYLNGALVNRGITVFQFDLASTDLGKLAIALVDAATIVLGTSVVNGNVHPNAVYAAYVTNLLKPKLKYAAVVGSYGWSGKSIKKIGDFMPNLKLEFLDPVTCKGQPTNAKFEALDQLAESIEAKHRKAGLF